MSFGRHGYTNGKISPDKKKKNTNGIRFSNDEDYRRRLIPIRQNHRHTAVTVCYVVIN